ncbi:MAG: protein kinase [Pseudomonadota bacterium]
MTETTLPHSGATFGSYDLIELLGSGGMGEVWLARHRLMQRPAAVKLIRPDVLRGADAEQSRTVLRRFEREVRATAALRSPNTISIYDFGVAEDGTFYYAMELLEGLNLQAMVHHAGPLPVERAVHFLLQACDSLGEAHGQGLVHRDIKPGNLFSCRLGLRHDVLKVLDFGLVKLDTAPDARTQLTADGMMLGTPAFMAPEMARGKASLDGRCDLYALGCVAHWLVTGKLLFDDDSPIGVVMAHLTDEPEPPSKHSAMPIPAAFDEVVLRCLQKKPEDRYQSARELAAALEAIPLAPRWTVERAETWWSEHSPAQVEPAQKAISDHLSVLRPDQAADAPNAPRPVAKKVLEAERERAISELRAHFVESHIDATMLQQRIGLAEDAADVDALDRIFADLPQLPPGTALVPVAADLPVPVATPDEPVPLALRDPAASRSLISVFSGRNLAGTWRPPKQLRIINVFGGAQIDLRQAQLQPGCTTIRTFSVFGGCEVVVPPDLYVEVDGVGVLGAFEEPSNSKAQPPQGSTPWVRVTGFAVLGGVGVKVKGPDKPGLLQRLELLLDPESDDGDREDSDGDAPRALPPHTTSKPS